MHSFRSRCILLWKDMEKDRQNRGIK
jgi:hypothetical protein